MTPADSIPTADDPQVLFVDNFDSFTYNLVEYVSEHAETTVVRNTVSIETVREADPDAIVISPGPGRPANDRDVGVSVDVLRDVSPEVPTLGVCLGLEAAVHAYGGTVGRAPEPVHGKTSSIAHDGKGVYRGLDQGFRAGRYHSLIATDVPASFEVTATTDGNGGRDGDGHGDGNGDEDAPGEPLVMGIRHREYPIAAVQFHPESVLTADGHAVIRNFLREYAEAEDRDRHAELRQ